MTVAFGTRLRSYEVVAQIGADGMNEVYRARDTKLGPDAEAKRVGGMGANANQRRAELVRRVEASRAIGDEVMSDVLLKPESLSR